MAKRCQVCDGPVKGDRCVLCGMLYRSDEELYHLNESRSTHYGHVNEHTRKLMRAQEVALPDRNNQAVEKHKEFSKASSAAGKKILSAEFVQAEREKIASQLQPSMWRTKKRKAGIALPAIIVIILIQIVVPVISVVFNSVRDTVDTTSVDIDEELPAETEWYDDNEYKTLEEAVSEVQDGSFLSSFHMYPEDAVTWMTEGEVCAVLSPKQTWMDWDAGYYLAVIDEGFGTIHISGDYGVANEKISSSDNYLVFELADGEDVQFQQAEEASAMLYIYSLDLEDIEY